MNIRTIAHGLALLIGATYTFAARGQTTVSLAIQDNLEGWLNLAPGQELQLVGTGNFEIAWLFDKDPCESKRGGNVTYHSSPGRTTATCTIKGNANDDGNYALTINRPGQTPKDHPVHIFVRVGNCKPCLIVKPDPKPGVMNVPAVAIGCDAGHAKAAPPTVKADSGSTVMWVPVGPDKDWSVHMKKSGACKAGQEFDQTKKTCIAGKPSKTAYDYTVHLDGCAQDGTGKLKVIP